MPSLLVDGVVTEYLTWLFLLSAFALTWTASRSAYSIHHCGWTMLCFFMTVSAAYLVISEYSIGTEWEWIAERPWRPTIYRGLQITGIWVALLWRR